jgi:uncharacterized protein (DUF1501 family)
MPPITRRNFLQTTALFSAIGLAPKFLTQAAAAEQTIAGFRDDRVLVVLQLGGGNDGLNTVVPFSNDTYHRLRPKLGLKDSEILKLNDDLALNSGLKGMMELYDDGQLAIIEGVGYPNPDRSHFRSMEILHTASDSDQFESRGWIGRYFDNCCSGEAKPQAGVAVGGERPQAFEGEQGFGIATDHPARFGWAAGDGADTEEAFLKLNAEHGSGNDTLDFLRHTTTHAVLSSRQVQSAAQKGKVTGPVGRGRDLSQLEVVAGLIRGGLDTRIYYVSIGGFDTHANQEAQHARLLSGVGDALARFQAQLEKDGTADRVTTLVFSEFGRRVQENGSAGTDHGTAAPMFLVGKDIRPGIHGASPSLDHLDEGDLKHTTDFRSVYATLLEDWFAVDAELVLGRKFETLPLLRG